MGLAGGKHCDRKCLAFRGLWSGGVLRLKSLDWRMLSDYGWTEMGIKAADRVECWRWKTEIGREASENALENKGVGSDRGAGVFHEALKWSWAVVLIWKWAGGG